jgi:cystathionine beta-lyase/cystathionine gamma-synthase
MYRFDTLAIHAGQPNDEATGAVTVPIYQTSTFGQLEPGVHRGFGYARTEHPTRRALEECLASLEGARYGLAFASGMAAIHNVLSLLRTGDHVVSTQDLYGGAWRIFTKYFAKFGIDFTFVDTSDVGAVEGAIRPETKILWLETPSNPLLKTTDIAACSAIARRAGIRTVADNTFATPVLQQPIALGADIVLHSTTKYINGHSDALGGAVITDDEGLFNDLKFFQNAIGAVPGPQDCFLILRGVKTLGLRMARHCQNAAAVVEYLRSHEHIAKIHYPGFGAIVSFELDADVIETISFTKRLRLWTLAESLGSVKSLFCHPPTMTHASVETEVRRKVGIADGLIRLSIGLEDVRDLIDDLDQALAEVAVTRRLACGA